MRDELAFNTLRSRQNGRRFPDDIFQWIFFHEKFEFRIKFVVCSQRVQFTTLQWRHNEHNGVSNHQPAWWLFTQRFILVQIKETSKLRVTGLCAGNSPVIGEFLVQKASNAENFSIWWRHDTALVQMPWRQAIIWTNDCLRICVSEPQWVNWNVLLKCYRQGQMHLFQVFWALRACRPGVYFNVHTVFPGTCVGIAIVNLIRSIMRLS